MSAQSHAPPIAAIVVAPIAAVIAIAALKWIIGRGQPAQIEADSGTIRPERWTAILTVLFGSIFCVFALVAIFAGFIVLGGLCALVFGAIAGFMAPSLTDVHRVHWDASGIDGPAKTFGPTLAHERTKIAWSDIAKTGVTTTSYWYVEAHDGRRIHWSYLYKGHDALRTALERHCPQLVLKF